MPDHSVTTPGKKQAVTKLQMVFDAFTKTNLTGDPADLVPLADIPDKGPTKAEQPLERQTNLFVD